MGTPRTRGRTRPTSIKRAKSAFWGYSEETASRERRRNCGVPQLHNSASTAARSPRPHVRRAVNQRGPRLRTKLEPFGTKGSRYYAACARIASCDPSITQCASPSWRKLILLFPGTFQCTVSVVTLPAPKGPLRTSIGEVESPSCSHSAYGRRQPRKIEVRGRLKLPFSFSDYIPEDATPEGIISEPESR